MLESAWSMSCWPRHPRWPLFTGTCRTLDDRGGGERATSSWFAVTPGVFARSTAACRPGRRSTSRGGELMAAICTASVHRTRNVGSHRVAQIMRAHESALGSIGLAASHRHRGALDQSPVLRHREDAAATRAPMRTERQYLDRVLREYRRRCARCSERPGRSSVQRFQKLRQPVDFVGVTTTRAASRRTIRPRHERATRVRNPRAAYSDVAEVSRRA